MMKKKIIQSTRTRMALAFISLAVLPLLLLGSLLIRQNFTSLKDHAKEMVKEKATRVAAEINSFIQIARTHVELFPRLPGLAGIPPQEQHHLLQSLIAIHPEFDEFILLDANGRVTFKISREGEEMTPDDLLFDNPAFLTGLQEDHRSVTTFFLAGPSARPSLLVGVSYRDSTGRQNSIIGRVNFQELTSLFEDLKKNQGMDISLVDSTGHLIALEGDSRQENQRVIASDGLQASPPHVVSRGINGREVIRYVYPLALTGNELHVIAEQSTDAALASARRLLKTFIVTTVLVLFASFLLMALLVENMVRPIKDLVRTARKIMQGNLAAQARIFRPDEIGELAKNFNMMTAQLRVSLDELLQEIRQRTQTQRALQQELEINEALNSLAGAMLATGELNTIANLVLDQARFLTGSKHGFISVSDPKTGEIICQTLKFTREAACRVEDKNRKLLFPSRVSDVHSTLLGTILNAREPFWTNDLSGNPRSRGVPDGHLAITKFLSVPVMIEDELIGQIALANPDDDYTPKDVTTVERLSKLYTLAIIRNRSLGERETLLNALRQAQKMEAIGTLAGGIAHDFNNILTPILGYAELIQATAARGSETESDIKQIIRATRRAIDLVGQILTFSRQREHARQLIEPHLILKEALKLLRAIIPTSIEIKQHIDEGCGSVLADPTQLHQVIMNLCTNAYHAMQEEGGRLTISLRCLVLEDGDQLSRLELLPGDYLCLAVSDTGMGIRQEIAERIFDPYFSTKDEGRGTGLGLSVVHGIVKTHGGAIDVQSIRGKGTTFTIYLPRITKDQHIPAHEADENTPLAPGSERLLIVDDEESIIRYETRMLKKLGYRVFPFSDSRQALEAFETDPDNYDLVITDMTMPHLNGVQLAQSLLAMRQELPIILCTGYSELISAEKAFEIGIKEYLTKPATLQHLSSAIRRALDKESPTPPT